MGQQSSLKIFHGYGELLTTARSRVALNGKMKKPCLISLI